MEKPLEDDLSCCMNILNDGTLKIISRIHILYTPINPDKSLARVNLNLTHRSCAPTAPSGRNLRRSPPPAWCVGHRAMDRVPRES